MSLRHVSLVCALCLVCLSSAAAQGSVRLRFEIMRNGSVIANPEISVAEGSVGRIEIRDSFACAFTPTMHDSHLDLAFDIRTGDRRLPPRLVIGETNPAVVSWTSASGALIKMTIVAIR